MEFALIGDFQQGHEDYEQRLWRQLRMVQTTVELTMMVELTVSMPSPMITMEMITVEMTSPVEMMAMMAGMAGMTEMTMEMKRCICPKSLSVKQRRKKKKIS